MSNNNSTTPSTTPESARRPRSNSNSRSRTSNTSIITSDGVSFEGACPDINGIVALRTEKITKKVPFSIFIERLAEYALSDIEYGSDLENAIRFLQDPTVGFKETHMPPPLHTDTPTFDEKFLQQERLKSFIVRENMLKRNCSKLYSIIWRQCSSALQAVIKGLDEYTSRAMKHDFIWLLKQIKKVTSGVDVKANPHDTLFESISALINMRQYATESNDHYIERFKSNVHTVELAKGGHIFCSHELVQCASEDDITDEEINRESEKFKAIICLRRSDDSRYKQTIEDLKRSVHYGRDEYPKSITAVHDLLNRQSGQLDRYPNNNRRSGNQGTTFAQSGSQGTQNVSNSNTESRNDQCTPVPGIDGRVLPNILCYNCQKMGHYAGQCPEEDRRQQGSGAALA